MNSYEMTTEKAREYFSEVQRMTWASGGGPGSQRRAAMRFYDEKVRGVIPLTQEEFWRQMKTKTIMDPQRSAMPRISMTDSTVDSAQDGEPFRAGSFIAWFHDFAKQRKHIPCAEDVVDIYHAKTGKHSNPKTVHRGISELRMIGFNIDKRYDGGWSVNKVAQSIVEKQTSQEPSRIANENTADPLAVILDQFISVYRQEFAHLLIAVNEQTQMLAELVQAQREMQELWIKWIS
jgi:hypothetical protein